MLYRVYCRRNERNGSLFPMPDAAFGFGLSAARLSLAVSTIYGNLAVSLMALGKIDEAGTVLSEAAGRNLQSDYLLQVNYWRELLRGNSDEMKRILLRSLDVPGAQSLLLSEQANTEAYFGHFDKARQLSNCGLPGRSLRLRSHLRKHMGGKARLEWKYDPGRRPAPGEDRCRHRSRQRGSPTLRALRA